MLQMFQVRLQESADTLDLFCDMCKVKCSGSANMRDHMASKKHKVFFLAAVHSFTSLQLKAQKSREGKKLGRFACELCGIECSDELALDTHM